MAWFAFAISIQIIFFLITLEIGHATDKYTRVMEATAPGDIIIGGIFPIHEDVDKNNFFSSHQQSCIR